MTQTAALAFRPADVTAAARALVPVLRSRAAATHDLGRLPEETVRDLADARLFELMTPACYGGLQSDIRTYMDAMVELGRGDTSVSWVATIVNISNWFVATLFPPDVSAEVFARPGARVAAVLQPRRCKARRVEGGYVLEDGLWGFNSGVHIADWDLLGFTACDERGEPSFEALALLPAEDVNILDDWNTIGVRGSGSSSVTVNGVFVPDRRITRADHARTGAFPSVQLADQWLYRSAFTPLGQIVIAFPALGAGLAALELFLEELPKRAITGTAYKKQIEAPVTHLQLGEASAKIDAARLIIANAAADIEEAARAGIAMEPIRRARVRRDTGFADRLIWEAADLLADASGGSFAAATNALNRVWRDVRVASLHGSLVTTSVYELYGRMICGLDRNGMNI